jgi:DHA1 family multidrug resistance protein-like MFS transporter
MLIAALIALFWVREDHVVRDVRPSRLRQDVGEALRNAPLATVLLLTLCTYLSIMTIEPVLPLYIVQLGGSTRDAPLLAGVVFSISGIAAILFAPRWGRLGDRVGFRVPLLVGLVGGGLGNLAQIPFHTVIGFTVVRFVYGAFFAAVFPALNGLIVQATAADFRGRAFGLSQSASQIGTMLGPLVGGVVAGAYGIHNVFWLTGLLLLATSLLSARTRPAPGVQA